MCGCWAKTASDKPKGVIKSAVQFLAVGTPTPCLSSIFSSTSASAPVRRGDVDAPHDVHDRRRNRLLLVYILSCRASRCCCRSAVCPASHQCLLEEI